MLKCHIPEYEPGAHAGHTPTPVSDDARPVAQLLQNREPMRATGPCAVSCVAAQGRQAVAPRPCLDQGRLKGSSVARKPHEFYTMS